MLPGTCFTARVNDRRRGAPLWKVSRGNRVDYGFRDGELTVGCLGHKQQAKGKIEVQ